MGGNLSDAAGAFDRRLLCRRSTDILARLLAKAVGASWAAIHRRGSAGRRHNIGTEMVVKAPPDGYTLLMATSSNAINATLYKNLNFNFIRDIAPVASIARTPLVMVVNPSFPAKTVPDSSPMPRPIRARSTWRRPGSGARPISAANCSRR